MNVLEYECLDAIPLTFTNTLIVHTQYVTYIHTCVRWIIIYDMLNCLREETLILERAQRMLCPMKNPKWNRKENNRSRRGEELNIIISHEDESRRKLPWYRGVNGERKSLS